MSTAALLLTSLALVSQDAAPLRASASDTATVQAQLWAGDALEVRGEKQGFLQVWDHKRERPGYIRAAHVKPLSTDAAQAPELLTIVRFLRDTAGAESLGIAYAAAYVKAVAPAQLNPEAWDAVGQMAERLAARASLKTTTSSTPSAADAKLAGHLDGVAAYGVKFHSWEADGSVRLCYDGDAYKRLLALPHSIPPQRARAVLGLTRHDCIPPDATPKERHAIDQARAQALDSLSAGEWAALPERLRQLMQLRQAGVWASIAYTQERQAATAASQAAGERALQALAAVNVQSLGDDDKAAYQDAAVRVGASRWATQTPPSHVTAAGVRLQTRAGAPGETCLQLLPSTAPSGPQAKTPVWWERCTWGVPWLASARISPQADAVAVAVQPLATWRELWLLKKTREGTWTVDIVPPSVGQPLYGDMGYVEWAGWAAEAEPKVLLARESYTEGRWQRRFEVVWRDTLAVDKSASTPQLLAGFKRWADPVWTRLTVALR